MEMTIEQEEINVLEIKAIDKNWFFFFSGGKLQQQ